ncbi:MAG: pyridoxal-phosphate dependent enzyme [Anaerolineae bacterium]|nr:pyridoxal-phosphate dependent enzyme [Anaerolineae bacterium]
MPDPITLRDVYRARRSIASIVLRTPLLHSPVLSQRAGAPIYMKLESAQITGSFKLRGAANKMRNLSDEARARGVITVSSGNHGRAVAYVAGQLGVDAVVCLAGNVPANKVAGIKRYGAQVMIAGSSYDETTAHALALQKTRGLTFVHPFDDPDVIAGQGTTGLEILEDLPDVDTVIVPLSGGGLISGIALALKSASRAIRVIGVSMARAPVMYHCLQAGRIVSMPEEPTLADALVGGLGDVNHYTFDMCRELLDDAALVSEDEIAEAMAFMLDTHHLVVEGGGAVGVAALLSGKVTAGGPAAVVVTGSNVDTGLLAEIAGRYG